MTTESKRPRARALLAATALIGLTLLAGFHLTAGARADAPVTARVRVSQTAVLKGGDGRVQLELLLHGREALDLGDHPRVPTDFVVILDRSGSMEGDKIENGRAAIRELVSRLDERDRFGLVAYSYDAQLVHPLEQASPEAKRRWNQTADSITVGGGTNMSRGLDVAASATAAPPIGDARERAVRVILISDGLANEGDATPEGLARRASRFGERGQTLTTIGVGLDFNEVLMTALADRGAGNYYFLEGADGLPEVFARELAAGRETVARALRVTLRPGASVEVLDAAGYPLERDGTSVSFQPGALFAGQERRVWVTYRVPSDAVGSHSLGNVSVSYEAGGVRRTLDVAETATVACVVDDAAFFAAVDKDAYKDSVLNESYGNLKLSVARAVREGDLERAQEAIASYRVEKERMQQALELPELEVNLQDVAELEEELEEAFSGEDQATKQNRFSKVNQSEATDMRRAGGKKGGKP